MNFKDSSAVLLAFYAVFLALGGGAPVLGAAAEDPAAGISPLPDIRVEDSRFVAGDSGKPFMVWGFNYDHDSDGRLLEDYWEEGWETVAEDFREMKQLGANVVRIHLQFGRFMESPEKTNHGALDRLARLVQLAEETGLYLNLTGLGCYHKDDIPPWYDPLPEQERWRAQAVFWEGIARTCRDSGAIFCYDLMNEPVVGDGPNREGQPKWLAGDLDGKYFVQRICLDLKGRTRREVAAQWVETMVQAVRRHDSRHLITVGVIPWALTFPGAEPLFYAPEAAESLDFVSVHFYPRRNQVDRALKALRVYELGKPLVVEETFPLRCSFEEMDAFMDGAGDIVDGWISFYWGETYQDTAPDELDLKSAIIRQWLDRFSGRMTEGEKN